jgi:hypothetical protein
MVFCYQLDMRSIIKSLRNSNIPDPIPSIQVPFRDSIRKPEAGLASEVALPSKSRSALQAQVCSQYEDEVAVKCAVVCAATQLLAFLQLASTFDPFVPPMQKLQNQNPTSPGLAPAVFTSTKIAPRKDIRHRKHEVLHSSYSGISDIANLDHRSRVLSTLEFGSRS